ncbi:hypothetical protein [Streptomyces sp. NPDC057429]|uniref:hypothetical protein n=1 Tax=Streptomyces sp. NPDC057429 TaxID=3346130 RepID=UPI0036B21B1B
MPDLLAGTTVLALDTPPTQSATGDSSFDATSTSYTTTATAGSYSEVAVVFVAPTTGRVKWTLSGRLINSATGGALITCEVREGATIGAGTIVESAGDRGPSHYGATFARSGTSRLLTGLTPGSTYNARVLHRVTAGTGSFALRELIVEPCT